MQTTTIEKPTTTSRYWGYRELTADELLKVGGGDGDGADGADGDDGDDSDDSDDNDAPVPSLAEVTVTATAISDDGMQVAGLAAEVGKAVLGAVIGKVIDAALPSLATPVGPVNNDQSFENNPFFTSGA